jgi:hypothetical protein
MGLAFILQQKISSFFKITPKIPTFKIKTNNPTKHEIQIPPHRSFIYPKF